MPVRVRRGRGGDYPPDEREHRERAGHDDAMMVATADNGGRIVQSRMAMRAKAWFQFQWPSFILSAILGGGWRRGRIRLAVETSFHCCCFVVSSSIVELFLRLSASFSKIGI